MDSTHKEHFRNMVGNRMMQYACGRVRPGGWPDGGPGSDPKQSRNDHPLRCGVSPSGTERLSINCCLTKSIQAGCYSRKPLALAAPKSKTMALWSGIFIPIPISPLFLMRYLGMSSRRNCSVQISQKKNFPFNYSFDSTRLSNACRDTCGNGTFVSSLKSHFSTRIMFHSFYDIFLK